MRLLSGLLVLFAATSPLFFLAATEADSPNRKVVILCTASVRGETADCGCAKNPMGGLARRATLIREARGHGEVLLVDAGDFGASNGFDYWKRTEFQWEMMAAMGYDVVTVGPNELIEGREALQGLIAREPSVQVVSANVTDKDGKLLFPESTTLVKGGVTYGITGVTAGSLYDFNKTRSLQKIDDIGFQDMEASLERVLPRLRKETDVVVVLMHVSPAEAKRIVNAVQGMDVIVVGHNAGYLQNPDKEGETLIVRPGARGQHLYKLSLTLGGKGEIQDFLGEGVPIVPEIAGDSALAPRIAEFEATYEANKHTNLRMETAAAAALQGTDKYLGAEVCGRCHLEQYATWVESPHAKALQALAQDNPHLEGVQCESCHGMGTLHGTPAMDAKPSESACAACHDGKQSKALDFVKAIAAGEHH